MNLKRVKEVRDTLEEARKSECDCYRCNDYGAINDYEARVINEQTTNRI